MGGSKAYAEVRAGLTPIHRDLLTLECKAPIQDRAPLCPRENLLLVCKRRPHPRYGPGVSGCRRCGPSQGLQDPCPGCLGRVRDSTFWAPQLSLQLVHE